MSIPTLDNYQKLVQRIDLLSKCHVLMFDENLQGDPIQKLIHQYPTIKQKLL